MARFCETHVRKDNEVMARLMAITDGIALYRIFYCERDGSEVSRITSCSAVRFLRDFRRVP